MESQQKTFKETAPKEKKTMRNKERTSHQSGWHNMSSGTEGSKGGESVVPRNLRMTL